jgi:transposase
MVDRIKAAGRNVVVLESFRSNQVKKTYCSTDKTSAENLARVYLSGLAHVVWHPDELTRARREVLHSYNRATKDSTRGRNRIRSWLTEHGLKSKAKGLRIARSEGLDWVLNCREWTPIQRLLIRQMFTDLWQAEARRKELKSIMAKEITSDPALLQLVRLFGVRHVTVYALAAVIGDINRFRTPKQLVAYVGLMPRVNSSGEKTHRGRLARYGRKELRRMLIQSAKSVVRYNNEDVGRWARHLAAKKGHNLATIAAARKILVSCWYLMNGRFTQIKEIPAIIEDKIRDLSCHIPAREIKDMGFDTKKAFIENRLGILINYS